MMRGFPMGCCVFFFILFVAVRDMLREKTERLISIQPYFVMAADDFCQHVLVENGISHFFSFSNKSDSDITVPLLVDGCSNLIFEYKDGGVRTHLIGSTVETRTFSVKSKAEYFGVRLLPSGAKFFIDVPQKETIGKIFILDECESMKDFCHEMSLQRDFESRMVTFMRGYETLSKAKDSQHDLFNQISDLIIQRRGKVKVSELESLSGYSSRYLNKIFEKELGMSPKQLCNTVKFQFLLSDINQGEMKNMTSISSEYNFYDQSHFIHEFKEFAGVTPKEYAGEVVKTNYSANIKNV